MCKLKTLDINNNIISILFIQLRKGGPFERLNHTKKKEVLS